LVAVPSHKIIERVINVNGVGQGGHSIVAADLMTATFIVHTDLVWQAWQA
jgi:hypothetical protein